MKSQLEWLQAIKSGDPARIKQAQISIAHRRAGLRTPNHASGGDPTASARRGLLDETPSAASLMGATPSGRPGTSGWMTPGTNVRGALQTPAMTPLMHSGDATPGGMASGSADMLATGPSSSALLGASSDLRAPPMNLDNYLAQHTSEDNASFSKVVGEEQQKKRIKVSTGYSLRPKCVFSFSIFYFPLLLFCKPAFV